MNDLIRNRKTFIAMLFLGASMLGYFSWRQLPVELFPNTELPFLMVMVQSAQDTDPKYVESEAMVPLEGAVGTLEGVDKIVTRITRNGGMITVFFNKGARVKYSYLKLKQKVDAIKSTIPAYYYTDVVRIDTDDFSNSFMSLQARGSGGLDRIRQVVNKEVKKQLDGIDGISNVNVFGGRDMSVEVILDPEVCKAFNITPSQVAGIIRSNGANNNQFVGQVTEAGRKYYVNVVSEYRNVNDLENIIILPAGPVRLKDVGEVRFGSRERTTISRINGQEALSLELVRDSQVNLISLSKHTRKIVEKLNTELKSQDIELIIQQDSAKDMEKDINKIVRNGVIGGILAVLILWIFLRNARLVLIVALAIPISIMVAFNVFYARGITINSLTLIGMALAIGMLLDNSVVVLENIYRLRAMGKSIDVAVSEGVAQVWRSISAATLTTIAVFLPFLFSSNFIILLVGKNIGVSIISTLLISLSISLLLVPMVTHMLLKHGSKNQSAQFQFVSKKNRLVQIYTVLLKTGMRHPLPTIAGTVGFFFVSVILCMLFSLDVNQEHSRNSFNIYLTMSKGATLEMTDTAVADVEGRLTNFAEVKDLEAIIMEGEAIFTLNLHEKYSKIDNRSLPTIKQDARDRLAEYKGARISFEPPPSSTHFQGGGGGGGDDFGEEMEMFGIGMQQEKIVIKGNDYTKMRQYADGLRHQLQGIQAITSSSTNVAGSSPEIHLMFDPLVLSFNDIPLSSVANELNTFSREFSSNATYKQGAQVYDITIRNSDFTERDKDVDDLLQMPIKRPTGSAVELQYVSKMVYSSGSSSIKRKNQEKQIELKYQFATEITQSRKHLDAAREEVDKLVAQLPLPVGMAVEVVHQNQDLKEFKFLIGTGFLLIFMILAAVFGSMVSALVMMFTVPLAAIGALWMLIFTKTSVLSMYTMTGFLILLGVVVNNGIILLDYALILRKRGWSLSRALITAGQARLRPILITAITTIVAMIPLAMGKNEEASLIGAPFAITVIGGLSFSTLFTLIFIPVVFSGVETALAWLRNLDWRIKLAQLVVAAVSCWLIWAKIDSLVWRLLWISVLIFAIPGLTWFLLKSLRRAAEDVIPVGDSITIQIRNLHKIYERPTRFRREWNKERECSGDTGSGSRQLGRKISHWLWQLPLLIFMVYFVYFYVSRFFWAFALAHVVYFYGFMLLKPLIERQKGGVSSLIYGLFYWGFPLVNVVLFIQRGKSITGIVFVGVIWLFALTIYSTSRKIHRDNIKVSRLKGRLSGLRKAFYRMVLSIPVIGKKKVPFEALGGVSLEIGSGMFGLLGPNGAGKTTLMRIICGILEQSYGKIYINGVDTADKREELQGLIGYLPQSFGTYENMTAWEFLNYQAILKNLTDKTEREKMVKYVLESVNIYQHRDKNIGSFSGGMKQRVGIAQILLKLPRILVVDEPTAGLDPRERIRFRNLLVELSRERVVIFSTHIIEDIYSSCNQVAVLNQGQLIYADKPVNMAAMADGCAWQFDTPHDDFEQVRKDLQIVHHARMGEMVRARCLSATQPHPAAVQVEPTLEDSYIWLLRSHSQKLSEAN